MWTIIILLVLGALVLLGIVYAGIKLYFQEKDKFLSRVVAQATPQSSSNAVHKKEKYLG